MGLPCLKMSAHCVQALQCKEPLQRSLLYHNQYIRLRAA